METSSQWDNQKPNDLKTNGIFIPVNTLFLLIPLDSAFGLISLGSCRKLVRTENRPSTVTPNQVPPFGTCKSRPTVGMRWNKWRDDMTLTFNYLLALYCGPSRSQLELWGAQKPHLCCLQLSVDSLLHLESSTNRGYTSSLGLSFTQSLQSTSRIDHHYQLHVVHKQDKHASHETVPFLPVSQHLWARDWALQQRSTRSWRW